MAERKPLFQSAEGFQEEMAIADSITLGGLTMGGAIAMADNKITGLGDGSDPGDVLNKAQIDALVATGNVFKEPVHSQYQLINGASGGIAALEVLFFANQPGVGDQVVLYDGTNTETYTFVANIAGESLPNDVSIETDAATAMQRLVTRINADASNTFWTAYYHATSEFNGGNGEIHVIEDKTPVDAISTSRIYGNTWGTPADFQVVAFSDGVDYTQYNEGTAAQAGNADPTSGRFGLSRGEATLIDGEVHLALDLNAQFSWEDSAQTWNQISGSGAIPDATSGSGGDVKGLVTLDSDKGLQIVSDGIAEAKLEANKGIQFESGGGLGIKIASANELSLDSSGLNVEGVPDQFNIGASATAASVTAANLGTLTAGVASDADALHTHDGLSSSGHTHAHADTTGQTANDHHNQAHAIDGGDHTLTGATSGYVLTATSPTTFGFVAPGAASKAPKISAPYTTATDITANGDAVYWNGTDTLGEARADTDVKARCIGVIQTGGGAAGSTVEVVTAGPCTGVLGGGGVANTPYYLGVTGGITSTPPGAGNRVVVVGYAMNANDLFVEIRDYGKKAA